MMIKSIAILRVFAIGTQQVCQTQSRRSEGVRESSCQQTSRRPAPRLKRTGPQRRVMRLQVQTPFVQVVNFLKERRLGKYVGRRGGVHDIEGRQCRA